MKRRHIEESASCVISDGCPQAKSVCVAPFAVGPISRFDGKFPLFQKPSEIGGFSLNATREYVDDRSQLRVYCPPNDSHVEWDLSRGYNVYVQRDEHKEYLDNLLRWIQRHRHSEFVSSGSNTHTSSRFAEFVCWRGLLTKLLCTPYEKQEGWVIAVCRFRGTLYLCEFELEESQNRVADERQKEMSYWGFKFESYITAADEKSVPDVDSPVNSKEEFASVVRTCLGSHTLVFGAEVDCRDRNDNSSYLELKTSRLIEWPRQELNFKRFKLLRWWAQSFLIGISRIICGFRDDAGIVRKLQEFPTLDIPRQSRDVANGWRGNICFNFADKFLEYVKDAVQQDYDKAVYVFTWSPGKPVVCQVEHTASSQHVFLPSWYTGDPSCRRTDETHSDSG